LGQNETAIELQVPGYALSLTCGQQSRQSRGLYRCGPHKEAGSQLHSLKTVHVHEHVNVDVNVDVLVDVDGFFKSTAAGLVAFQAEPNYCPTDSLKLPHLLDIQ